MDFAQLGLMLAKIIEESTRRAWPSILERCGGDRAIMYRNLRIFFTWVATKRTLGALPQEPAVSALNAMHESLSIVLQQLGWNSEQISAERNLLQNRYAAYNSADQGEDPLRRICNFFLASCGNLRYVAYEEIVPDPEHLAMMEAEFPGLVDMKELERLRRLRDAGKVITYPLTGQKNEYVASFVGPLVRLVDDTILKFVGV